MYLNRELFLASSSLRRKELLKKEGLSFTVIPNLLKDEEIDLKNIRKSVKNLAYKKVLSSKNGYNGLILGVDTIVVIENIILGKPQSLEEAKRFLRLLSGKSHLVFSGLCLYDTLLKKTTKRSCITELEFKLLTDQEIDFYCTNYKVLDKAGAYAIQEYAGSFIKKIKGPIDNVIGLPMKILLKLLKNYVIVS